MENEKWEVVSYNPDEVYKEFSAFIPKDSIVIHDNKRKTISVSNAFNGNRIKIKVRAPYETWLEFEKSYMENLAFFNLNIVKPHCSPKKNISLLDQYYTFYPYKFSLFFYEYYVNPANKINPYVLFSRRPGAWITERKRKPRGGNPHGRPIDDIRYISMWLYAFLKYWLSKQPVFDELPANIKDFCEEIGLMERWDEYELDETPAKKALRDTYYIMTHPKIDKRLKFSMIENNLSEQSFYKKYILFRTKSISFLKHIEGVLKRVNYEPEYWLKKLRPTK